VVPFIALRQAKVVPNHQRAFCRDYINMRLALLICARPCHRINILLSCVYLGSLVQIFDGTCAHLYSFNFVVFVSAID